MIYDRDIPLDSDHDRFLELEEERERRFDDIERWAQARNDAEIDAAEMAVELHRDAEADALQAAKDDCARYVTMAAELAHGLMCIRRDAIREGVYALSAANLAERIEDILTRAKVVSA